MLKKTARLRRKREDGLSQSPNRGCRWSGASSSVCAGESHKTKQTEIAHECLLHRCSKAAVLPLTSLVTAAISTQDVFTNKTPLWRPPGARGIYGGTGIAQCLSAAYLTVPEGWTIRSMHCYFVLAGNSEDPILYSVERVRDNERFATRTVQARQCGRLTFTTTLSFEKEEVDALRKTEYQTPMPEISMSNVSSPSSWDAIRPFQLRKAGILNGALFSVLHLLLASGKTAASYTVPSVFISLTGLLSRPYRIVETSSGQENQAMDPRARPHIRISWPCSSPLRTRLHVGQLFHRYCVSSAPHPTIYLAWRAQEGRRMVEDSHRPGGRYERTVLDAPGGAGGDRVPRERRDREHVYSPFTSSSRSGSETRQRKGDQHDGQSEPFDLLSQPSSLSSGRVDSLGIGKSMGWRR